MEFKSLYINLLKLAALYEYHERLVMDGERELGSACSEWYTTCYDEQTALESCPPCCRRRRHSLPLPGSVTMMIAIRRAGAFFFSSSSRFVTSDLSDNASYRSDWPADGP